MIKAPILILTIEAPIVAFIGPRKEPYSKYSGPFFNLWQTCPQQLKQQAKLAEGRHNQTITLL